MVARSLGQNQKLASASFANLSSGQKVNGIIAWTKRTQMGSLSWTSGFGRVHYKQEKESWALEQQKLELL